jgi:hypothetical protein
MVTAIHSLHTIGQIKQTKKSATSPLARVFSFKLKKDLQAVIAFPLLGIVISCIWLSGAGLAAWAFSAE